MSSLPVPARRHALGLPAGSVRASLVLGIVALFCAMVLVPSKEPVPIPPYLVYLMFITLGHFFAAHGVTIARRDDPAPSPLHLPGGIVRFLVIAALTGTIGWKITQDEKVFHDQFEASINLLKAQPFVPLVVLGGFFVGFIVRALLGRSKPPLVLQDFEAWISIVSMVFIVVAGVVLIINASVDKEQQLSLPHWEGFVGAVIAFYFGERS